VNSCPTCETDNTQWWALKYYDHLKRFPSAVWVAVGLVLVAALSFPVITYIAGLPTELASFLRLTSALSVTLSTVIVMVVYLAKWPLRNYELFRQVVKNKRRPGLLILAALSVGVAIVLFVFIVLLLTMTTIVPESREDLTYLYIAGLYGGFIPFFVLALMLIGANGYTKRIEEEFPRPLYLDTNHLAKVTLQSVCDNLQMRDLKIVSMSRTDDGGLTIVVSRQVKSQKKDEKGEFITVSEEKRYIVEADEWAHICSLKEYTSGKK
jgi:hypothetical protein